MDIANLYRKIRDRLLADPDLGIKHFALEAMQDVDQEDQDITYPKPAVIITIEPGETRSIGKGVQFTKVEFTLRVECEVIQEISSRESSTIQDKGLNHLALISAITKRLHRWGSDNNGTIGKTGQITGTVANNLVEHTLMFRCTVKDESGKIDYITGEDDLTPFQFKALNKDFLLQANETIDINIDSLTDNQSGLPGSITSIGSPSNNNIGTSIINNGADVRVESLSSQSEIITFSFEATNGIVKSKGLAIISVTQEAPSGIQYASYEALWSGQETSYHTGDEGWRYQNGEFESYILPNPERVMLLDPSDPTGLTLIPDNIYGNKNRYTAADGSQIYALFSVAGISNQLAIVIDHLFAMAIALPVGQPIGLDTTLAQAVAVGGLIDNNGFSNFSVISIKELTSIAKSQMVQPFDYAPFSFNVGSAGVCSCTIDTVTTNILTHVRFYEIVRNATYEVTDLRQYFYTKNLQSILQP